MKITALFINMVTSQTLQTTLVNIKKHMELNRMTVAPSAIAKATLDLQHALEADPLSTKASFNVCRIWDLVHQHSVMAACASLRQCYLRMNIMLLNLLAWQWLENIAFTHCAKVYGHATSTEISSETHWIQHLIHDVHHLVIHQQCRTITLHAQDYVPELQPKTYHCTMPHRIILAGEAQDIILSKIKDILTTWLEFPKGFTSHAQSIFTRAIISHWGKGSLLLEEVWASHHQVYKYVFVGRHYRAIRDVDVQLLHAHL